MNEPISSIKAWLIIASILWGIVSLKYLRPSATKTERIISFTGACAWTYFATPAILDYYGLSLWVESIIAFSLGIFFMQIVDILMNVLDSYRKDPRKVIDAIIKLKK